MTTRAIIVANALAQNGLGDGEGYPGRSNPADPFLGRPNEFWCADWFTYHYARAGLPLPLMQQGMGGKQTGFAYCPAGEVYSKAHGAWIPSWEGLPADGVLFDWNGDGVADHIEMLWKRQGSLLYTIGGDSGPSNVDHFRGPGGVHTHVWDDPVGTGNHLILGVIACGKLVRFDAPQPPHTQPTQPTVPAWYHRVLSFPIPAHPGTTRNIRTASGVKPMQYGPDVGVVQRKVGATVDDIYGPGTAAKVKDYQRHHGLTPDGDVGPVTASHMGP